MDIMSEQCPLVQKYSIKRYLQHLVMRILQKAEQKKRAACAFGISDIATFKHQKFPEKPKKRTTGSH